MGTTGTIMGVSQYLKEQNANIEIIGAQPEEGSRIPGIRKVAEAYLPKIFDRSRVDRTENVSQAASEAMARRLASWKVSSAGFLPAARAKWHCAWRARLRTRPSCSCLRSR